MAKLVLLWAKNRQASAAGLARKWAEETGRAVGAAEVTRELERLSLAVGRLPAGQERSEKELRDNAMDKINREDAGWLVALAWLSALEETARDFHGTRPYVFSARAYEHSVQYYLHLLGDEYGMQIKKADSIREAVENYIQIGVAGGPVPGRQLLRAGRGQPLPPGDHRP